MSERFSLAELSREEAGRLIPRSTVIMPIGAIEQHGTHLPIVTDTYIVEALCARILEHATVPILVAPTLSYGASQHHFPFPGVLSLSSRTLDSTIRDLLDSLKRSGARRVYLLNAHGGNDELIRLIGRETAPLHRMVIGAASYWSIAWEKLLESGAHENLGPVPGHAGGFETAIMMALRPDLVDGNRHGESTPETPSTWPPGSLGTVWYPHRAEPGTGTSDDARAASERWGHRLLDVIARRLAEELDRFHRDAEEYLRLNHARDRS